MLFKLIANVELLCSSADIDGVITPKKPNASRAVLKVRINL